MTSKMQENVTKLLKYFLISDKLSIATFDWKVNLHMDLIAFHFLLGQEALPLTELKPIKTFAKHNLYRQLIKFAL